MADLNLSVGLDDRHFSRDLANLQTKVKGATSSFASSFVGGLGISGALGAVIGLRAGFTGLLNDLAATDRLMDTIAKRQVVTAKMQAQIQSSVSGLQRIGIEDTEVVQALDKLISMTNDYQGSLRQLNLVTDLAVKLGGNWETAIKVVAFVMKGEIAAAGRLIPEIRALARVHDDLAGSQKGVEVGLRAIANFAGGAAVSEYNTLRGAMNAVKNAAGEIAEALVEGATGGNDMVTSLQQMNELLLQISENPGLQMIASVFAKGGISGMAITAAEAGTLSQDQVKQMQGKRSIFDWLGEKALPALGYSTGYSRAKASNLVSGFGTLRPTGMDEPSGADMSVFGFGLEETDAMRKARDAAILKQREEAAKRREQQFMFDRSLTVFGLQEATSMRMENVFARGPGISSRQRIADFGRDIHGRNAVADRMLAEDKARIEQMQLGIQNAVGVGLTAAFTGGDVKQAAKDLFTQSLVQALSSQIAKSITDSIFAQAGVRRAAALG